MGFMCEGRPTSRPTTALPTTAPAPPPAQPQHKKKLLETAQPGLTILPPPICCRPHPVSFPSLLCGEAVPEASVTRVPSGSHAARSRPRGPAVQPRLLPGGLVDRHRWLIGNQPKVGGGHTLRTTRVCMSLLWTSFAPKNVLSGAVVG